MQKNRTKSPASSKKYLTLAALLLVPALTTMAQSLWIGGTSDFNVGASWNPAGVPSGTVNASNDSGSNNIVLIQPGDPAYSHGDTLAGNGANTSGSYLQTGSTNFTGGGNWLRMGIGINSFGSYVLSNGVVNVGGRIQIGEEGAGYLEISGGTMTANVNDTGANPALGVGNGNFVVVTDNSPVGTVVINSGTLNLKNQEAWFGNGGNDMNSRGTGHLIMHGGTFNANNWLVFGRFGGVGDAYMDGGTINKNATGNIQIGVGSMNSGTVGALGTFTQSGGTINCLSEYHVATDANVTYATNTIGGTAVLNVANWIAIGRNGGQGTMNLSGNAAVTKTSNAGNITIGSGGTGVGIINQTGGSFTNTLSQTYVGDDNVGIWNLSAGTVVLGLVHLSQNASANGTFNLDGGNLTATEIAANLGSGTFNFNGGTLHAGADNLTFMHDLTAANILTGGAIINTDGHNITISQVLADGGGSLTKTGSGTLTLAGANYYSGSTLVNAGKLITTTDNGALAGYTVADNAGFGVTILAANAQFSPASLTLGTAGATTLDFNLGSFGNPTAAPLNVVGNYAANGTVTISVNDANPQLGKFPLIHYGSKSGSPNYVLGSLPLGVLATIIDNTANSTIELDITSIALDRWEGLAGGNWDINVTTNWIDYGTGLPVKYVDGDSVIFNDSALGTPIVNLVTTVQPSSISILNNATNFTLTGNGKISGNIDLNKQGFGTFTINTTNDFTGATVLSSGTLAVNNLANGGIASAIGASTATPTNLVFAGGALRYTGPAMTINRGYELDYNYSSNRLILNNTLDLQGDLKLTGRATAAPNTSFVKTGPGTLTYGGSVSNELSGGSLPGYNVRGGTIVFDGTAGGQTNHNQSEFWVGTSTNNPAFLVLSNTTLNVDSWFSVGPGNGANGFTSMAALYDSKLNSGNVSLGYQADLTNGTYLAQQTLTLNGNSIFNNTGNFNLAESAGSTATLTIKDNSSLYSANRILMGMQTGANASLVVANSGTLTNGGYVSIGSAGSATATLKDNAIWQALTDFNVTDVAGDPVTNSIATLNIQDNAMLITSTLYVGKNAYCLGTINQTGGSVIRNGGGDWRIGGNINGAVNQIGTYNLSAGTLNFGNANFQVGAYGTGYYNQSGGTAFGNGGYPDVGRFFGSVGYFNLSGGTFSQLGTGQLFLVGEQGTGTLNVSGTGQLIVTNSLGLGWAGGGNGTLNLTNGSIMIYKNLIIGNVAGGSGIVNLYGGRLAAQQISANIGASSSLNFDGGILAAMPGANTNFLSGLSQAYIYSGGVTVDSGTNAITITQDFYNGDGGNGGLTKIGSGTVNLNGNCYYVGPTTVSSGALGGIGTISGPVAVSAGAILAPGSSGIGTLTIYNTLNLAGTSTTVMELDKTAGVNDLVTGLSAVTYGGTLVLKNLNGTLVAGDTFKIFDATSYSGSFTVVSQTPGQAITWDTSKLTVDGTVKVASAAPAAVTITSSVSGGNLNLSWPSNLIGLQLQSQTNALTAGLGTNWVNVAGSTTTNQVSFPIDGSQGSVFFRLISQ